MKTSSSFSLASGLVFSLLATLSAMGQPRETRLDDFLGVKWGSTQTAAKKAMLARPDVTFDEASSDATTLFFDGGTVGGESVDYCALRFGADGLYRAQIVFETGPRARTIDQYDRIKASISGKYGQPSDDFKNFEGSYREGDGNEILAIRIGKASYSAFWRFPVAGTKSNGMWLHIEDDLSVSLTYENGDLAGPADEQRKAKKQSEW